MAGEPASSTDGSKVPVLLLKTKSSPTDAYEDLLSTPHDGFHFEPTFVPVLQHCFAEDGLQTVRELLQAKRINDGVDSAYGGLIFTSQRAVEAFAKLVDEGQDQGQGQGNDESWPHLQDVPIYSVGPATTRALKAISHSPPLRIFGEHTGTGDVLAQYIVEHYGEWYQDRLTKPPLLFLVGEQRRDIIPKTLMDDTLPADTRIEVTETVVYGTGVMESFPKDFGGVLSSTRDRSLRWVVVFSPTGCDSMLRGLGLLLDEKTSKVAKASRQRTTLIATIGPTTRDHLIKTFDFEPDACAARPSPEGIWEVITNFTCETIE
ncbi:uroporphyrinogen-III synthase [Xylaria castorea]|nr:uroporphyrinogen-III synthase [Xylaria castorea]